MTSTSTLHPHSTASGAAASGCSVHVTHAAVDSLLSGLRQLCREIDVQYRRAQRRSQFAAQLQANVERTLWALLNALPSAAPPPPSTPASTSASASSSSAAAAAAATNQSLHIQHIVPQNEVIVPYTDLPLVRDCPFSFTFTFFLLVFYLLMD